MGDIMQRIIVTGLFAEFHAGILELTPKQASARKHNLADLGDGLYEIKSPVMFKRGEMIGFDGDIGKDQAELIVKPEQKATGKQGKKD